MKIITFLALIYLLAGFLILFVLAPRYFRKRNIETFSKDDLCCTLFTSLEGIAFAILLMIFWPILAPFWLWTETVAKNSRSKFAQAESDKTASERKYESMTFDEKLAALEKEARSSQPDSRDS